MDWGFSWLLSFVNGFVSMMSDLLRWMGDGVVWAGKELLYLFFDGGLTIVEGVVSGLDLSSIAVSGALTWGVLPSQMIMMVNMCCIPQALAVIVSALGLRMALNLIPSWVTRV